MVWSQRLSDFSELAETKSLDDLSLNRLDQTINGIGSVWCEKDEDWRGAILFAYGSGARLQDVGRQTCFYLDPQNAVKL